MIKMLPALWTVITSSPRAKTSLAKPPLTSAVTWALTGSWVCGAASAGASASNAATINDRQRARRPAPDLVRRDREWSDLDIGQTAGASPARSGAEVKEVKDLLDRRNSYVRAQKRPRPPSHYGEIYTIDSRI